MGLLVGIPSRFSDGTQGTAFLDLKINFEEGVPLRLLEALLVVGLGWLF